MLILIANQKIPLLSFREYDALLPSILDKKELDFHLRRTGMLHVLDLLSRNIFYSLFEI